MPVETVMVLTEEEWALLKAILEDWMVGETTSYPEETENKAVVLAKRIINACTY